MDETTTSAFFRSVARAFADNGPGGPGAVAVLVVAGAIAGAVLAGALGRLRARRAALRTFLEAHGLGAEDLALVRALARDVGASPLQLVGHLDVFERASHRALAATPPGAADDPAAIIGRLRHALGFDRLAPHTPLLSTRELSPGTAVQLGDGERRHGVVVAVDERALRVEVEGPVALAPGDEVQLSIVHAREARYAARGRVAWSRPAPLDTTQVALSHDETPQRIQRREHVRVPADGIAALRPLRWPGVAPAHAAGAPRPLAARLLDASAGGLRVTAPEPLPVGLLVEVAFTLRGERFEGLRAVVLSAGAPTPAGRELHLEFSGVPARERDRLGAAVARVETRDRAAAAP